MVRELIARAPVRIDLGGGWTDVPPYPAEQGGCVCNLAIARYATVRLRARGAGVVVDDAGVVRRGASVAELVARDGLDLVTAALERAGVDRVAVELRNDFPRGAGLGGSSAAGVALQAALAAWQAGGDGNDLPCSAVELAERSRAVEVDGLHVAGGSQDHYAAALGGALMLRFGDDVAVHRIPLSPDLAQTIERRCVVVYTGESRISAATITAVLDGYRARVPRVVEALAHMRVLAERMASALEHGAMDELALLVGEHWEHQRALDPGITTPAIERVLEVARAAGATGGKALGASGGGSVLVIAPAACADRVRDAVSSVGSLVPFTVDEEGARVRVSREEPGGAEPRLDASDAGGADAAGGEASAAVRRIP